MNKEIPRYYVREIIAKNGEKVILNSIIKLFEKKENLKILIPEIRRLLVVLTDNNKFNPIQRLKLEQFVQLALKEDDTFGA